VVRAFFIIDVCSLDHQLELAASSGCGYRPATLWISGWDCLPFVHLAAQDL